MNVPCMLPATIHFGSRRPSVRNNVSNKLAHALFFQNAFSSWVDRASFLKLCLESTAIAGHVLSPAQGAALSFQKGFFLFVHEVSVVNAV